MPEGTPLNDRINAKKAERAKQAIQPEQVPQPESRAPIVDVPAAEQQSPTDGVQEEAINQTLQELTTENIPAEQHEQMELLDNVFVEREDALRQLEWSLARNPQQFADMLDTLFTIDKTQGNTYFSDTKDVLEAMGVKVIKARGLKCRIELPERLKNKKEGPIRPEKLKLSENYSMVSIRTRDVWRTSEDGQKIRVPQKFVVVEGNQQKFREIAPQAGWGEAELVFAQKWKQMQDLLYEYKTNATHDQPFYLWRQLSEEDETHLRSTISEEVFETMLEEGNAITARDFADPGFGMSKEVFDEALKIDELLSEDAVHQVYVHGWMGDNRVMADLIAQGLDETKALLEPGKVAVGIVFDMDGIHGNRAEMIPGARLGKEQMTSREGEEQVEFALHEFFGIQADTVWGWSKGGAATDEIHAKDAQLGLEGGKYMPMTAAKRKTCTFQETQQEQNVLEKVGSLTSIATLKTVDLLERFRLMKTMRPVVDVVGGVYTNLHLPGNEKTVRDAAAVHLINLQEEPDIKMLQDEGLKIYDGVQEDGREAIVASLQERKTWSMGVIATEDKLVNYGSLVREIRRENLGIPYAEYHRTPGEKNGTHAVLLEKQFLSEFPLGLINASTPQELHAFQELCQDLAVLRSLQLSLDTEQVVIQRGLEDIYGEQHSEQVRAALMQAAQQAIPHISRHVVYFDNRSREQYQLAKLHFDNRMRSYGLLEDGNTVLDVAKEQEVSVGT